MQQVSTANELLRQEDYEAVGVRLYRATTVSTVSTVLPHLHSAPCCRPARATRISPVYAWIPGLAVVAVREPLRSTPCVN